MDIKLYGRVLWRFRVLVIVGLIAACALATVAMFHVSSNGLKYRQTETWSSTARLFVTQEGFPWGRAVDPSTLAPNAKTAPRFADANRFTGLAFLYAQLATSDDVRTI